MGVGRSWRGVLGGIAAVVCGSVLIAPFDSLGASAPLGSRAALAQGGPFDSHDALVSDSGVALAQGGPFDSHDALVSDSGVALAQGGQPTFRAGTEIVSLGVTISDKKANFLSDLTRDDLEVFEDGKKQMIEYFARGDQDAAPELHIGLLFDTSGSMDADIKLSRSAAVKFLNTLSDAKDITLVDFDTEVRVAKYGQLDFPRLVERIRGRKPGGFTAMYDALGVYLDSAAELQGRKILVLFTDGGDTRSTIRFGDVLTLVRASDVTVYSIGFLENQPGSVRAEQRLRLTQLAGESGGEAFFPYAMKQIEEAYDKILMQIRAQYSLGYISTNTTADGSWRKVEIKVRRPDAKDLRIQSRKGYFAPYRK